MNHYPTWSILLSLRQTLLSVSSSERSFFFILFLHSASHYLTLCLYGPFIFCLFPYLGVKLNVDGVFCFAPSHILNAWHTAIFLYIFVERRKKAVVTLHIKTPIQSKSSMLTEELRARHHGSIHVQMLLPLNSSCFLSLDSSSAANPRTPAATSSLL